MNNKTFLDDLTVFVISVGSSQLKYALDSLKHQNCKFKIEIIKDVSPMSAAFNEMIKRCGTKYFIQLDEDMMLDENSVMRMYQEMGSALKKDPNIAIMAFRLKDEELGSILGVKIYNYKIIKNYKWENIPMLDRVLNEKLKSDGYKVVSHKDKSNNVGTHALNRDNFELFLKSVVVGSRILKTKKSDINNFFELYNNALNDNSNSKKILRLAGLFYGLFNGFEPDAIKYPKKEYKEIESLLPILSGYNINKKLEEANNKLYNIISDSSNNIFNLSDKIYALWKNKKQFYSNFDKNVIFYIRNHKNQNVKVFTLNDLCVKLTLALQLNNINSEVIFFDKQEAIKYSTMCKLIVGKNSIFLNDCIYDKDSYNILVIGKHVFKKFSQISQSLLNNYDEIIIDIEEVENISLNNFRYDQDKELSSINFWKKI